MPTFQSCFDRVSEDHIAQFEARIGATLPDSYKEFLLTWNGGEPSANVFTIADCDQSAILDLFYGIADSRQPGDLETERANRLDDLPDWLLPIGHDPGGNCILLATSGENRGRVYYWDSRRFFECSTEEQNTYLLANTFGEFLVSMHA
jgi:hypothetical protein